MPSGPRGRAPVPTIFIGMPATVTVKKSFVETLESRRRTFWPLVAVIREWTFCEGRLTSSYPAAAAVLYSSLVSTVSG